MTLDEAIKHAEEVAEEKEIDIENQNPLFPNNIEECKKCAEEHRQLAEWLKELKQLRELQSCWDAINQEDIAKAFQLGLAYGFGEKHGEMDKVIDEIKKVITPKPKIGRGITTDATHSKCDRCGVIFEIVSENGEANYCPNCGAKMESEDKE